MERDTPQVAYRETRGLAGRPASAPPGEGLVDEITREVRACCNDIGELTAILREHNDQTLGEDGPRSSNGAVGAKVVDGPFRGPNLRNSVSVLHSLITDLREQVIRARNI